MLLAVLAAAAPTPAPAGVLADEHTGINDTTPAAPAAGAKPDLLIRMEATEATVLSPLAPTENRDRPSTY
jgi:hypothetical protein